MLKRNEYGTCVRYSLLAIFLGLFLVANLSAQGDPRNTQQTCQYTNGTTDENPLGILLWHVNPPAPPPCALNKFEPGPGYPPNFVWYAAKMPGEHERAKAGQEGGSALAMASASILASEQQAGATSGAWEPSTLNPTGAIPTEAPQETTLYAEPPLPATQDPNARAQFNVPVEPAFGANESIYARSDVGSMNNSFECDQAASEVGKANEVSDSADKLFHLRKALRLCPQNAQYHQQLGEVYTSLGRSEDANFEFEEARRLDPNLRSALNGASLDAGTGSGVVNYY